MGSVTEPSAPVPTVVAPSPQAQAAVWVSSAPPVSVKVAVARTVAPASTGAVGRVMPVRLGAPFGGIPA